VIVLNTADNSFASAAVEPVATMATAPSPAMETVDKGELPAPRILDGIAILVP
jgi:hypothetical protein